MDLGLTITRFDWPGGTLAIGDRLGEIAEVADGIDVAELYVMDHFFQIGMSGPPEDPMLDGYLAATHLAAHSERARVGVLATGVHYRHPGLLIKAVTTLDVLSAGRAVFAVGAGWNERETIGLGVPFPPLKTRFELLEDTLRLAHQMWRDDDAPFTGTHVRAERPLNHPQPVSRPHPPIMVAGGGERKTLRLVAEYGDACNLFLDSGQTEPAAQVAPAAAKLAVLRERCAEAGRPYAAIRRTATTNWTLGPKGMTTAEAVAVCRAAHEAGIDSLIVNLDDVYAAETLDLLAPVVAEIRTWS